MLVSYNGASAKITLQIVTKCACSVLLGEKVAMVTCKKASPNMTPMMMILASSMADFSSEKHPCNSGALG